MVKTLRIISLSLVLFMAFRCFTIIENNYNMSAISGSISINTDFIVEDCTQLNNYFIENNIVVYRDQSINNPYVYTNSNVKSVPFGYIGNTNSVEYLCSSNNSGNYEFDTTNSSKTVTEIGDFLIQTYSANITVNQYETTFIPVPIRPTTQIVLLCLAICLLITSIIMDIWKKHKKVHLLKILGKKNLKIALILAKKDYYYFIPSIGLLFLYIALAYDYFSNYMALFIIIEIIILLVIYLLINIFIVKYMMHSNLKKSKKIRGPYVLLFISMLILISFTIGLLVQIPNLIVQVTNYNYYSENAGFYDDFIYSNVLISTNEYNDEIKDVVEVLEPYLIRFIPLNNSKVININNNFISYFYGEQYTGYSVYVNEADLDYYEQNCMVYNICSDDIFIYSEDIVVKNLNISNNMASASFNNPVYIIDDGFGTSFILPINDTLTYEYYYELISNVYVESDSTMGLQIETFETVMDMKKKSLGISIVKVIVGLFLGIVLFIIISLYIFTLHFEKNKKEIMIRKVFGVKNSVLLKPVLKNYINFMLIMMIFIVLYYPIQLVIILVSVYILIIALGILIAIGSFNKLIKISWRSRD